jgi:hypothetical protein
MPTIGIIRRQVSVSMARSGARNLWRHHHDRRLGFLDRSWRHVSPMWWPRKPDGTLHQRKLLVGKPEAYKDAAIQGIRDLLGVAQRAHPAERSATSRWAPRLPPTRCWSARATARLLLITKGIPRRAPHRLPGAARHLRPQHHPARTALRTRHRGRRAGAWPMARRSAADEARTRSSGTGQPGPTASIPSPSC